MSFAAFIKPKDFESGINDVNGMTFIVPLLLICVAYQFPSDPGRYHQTRMVFEIRRRDFDAFSPEPAVILGTDLQIADLSWEGAFYAD